MTNEWFIKKFTDYWILACVVLVVLVILIPVLSSTASTTATKIALANQSVCSVENFHVGRTVSDRNGSYRITELNHYETLGVWVMELTKQ